MDRINQIEDIIMTLEIDYLRFRDEKQFASGNRVRQSALKGLRLLKELEGEIEALVKTRDKLPEGLYRVIPSNLHLLEVGMVVLRDAVDFAKR